MSVKVNPQGDGYVVRWLEGGRHRSRNLRNTTKKQANDFYYRKKLARQTGGLLGNDERVKLHLWLDEWFERKSPKLAENTANLYRGIMRKHIVPHIGGYRLSELSPELIDEWQQVIGRGLGEAGRRAALVVLSGALKEARKRRLILSNPCEDVDWPPVRRKRAIRPIPLKTVEAMRAELLQRKRPRDAALISTLAYCGLRPAEARALQPSDVQEQTLLIDKSIPLTKEEETKNFRHRSVKMPRQLKQELAELRLSQGRLSKFIFPKQGGGHFTKTTWGNWRSRIWIPLAEGHGIPDQSPYSLRHTFATLLVYAGQELPTIAEQMGDTMETVLRNYVHVLRDFDPAKRMSIEEQIDQARGAVREEAVNE